MKPEDVLKKINEEIERIKENLPEKGRRFEALAYRLPKEYYNVLLQNLEFKRSVEKGHPNIGGIPVILSKEFKIDYFQGEKQRKYFKHSRLRKKYEQKKMES